MKQITHQCLAVASALTLDVPPLLVLGVWAGASLPDAIDRGLARLSCDREAAFARIHRGASHWFGWPLALLGLLALAPYLLPPLLRSPILFAQALLGGVAYGVLSHIALDALTPQGVPLSPFSPVRGRRGRFSLGLFPTGSLREYAFLVLGLVVCAPFALSRWPAAEAFVRELAASLGLCL